MQLLASCHKHPFIVFFVSVFFANSLLANTNTQDPVIAKKQCYTDHTVHLDIWAGPTSGPSVKGQKTVVYVASDMRNGGVDGVARGVVEAVQRLGWQLIVFDGKGTAIGQSSALLKAVLVQPDGIILGGVDAQSYAKVLTKAKEKNIPVVGWHALETARSDEYLGLFTNITTDVEEVARVAACFAINSTNGTNGTANVVILTDSSFSIARAKSAKLAQVIKNCVDCELLSVENISLADTATEVSRVLQGIMEKYGDRLTHIIGINDLYFDYAKLFFEKNKRYSHNIPKMISAGDGSRTAYARIRLGVYQFATIPEPLILQGWQAVDEINRALNQQAPSGYSAKVHVITKDNFIHVANDTYDPDNQYRTAYYKLWKPEAL